MLIKVYQRVPGLPEPPFTTTVERETNTHFFFKDPSGNPVKANKGACTVLSKTKGENRDETTD